MASRRVTKTGKDKDGDITKLCGPTGSTSKADAISDIEGGTNSYYVQDGRGRKEDVHVVKGPTGKYLRTDPTLRGLGAFHSSAKRSIHCRIPPAATMLRKKRLVLFVQKRGRG